ncbi:MAG TPA: tellurite resistance/C4-dicarboxylate transporter family protein [Actinomycetota bacterium]|jgi:tellurite resistance protein TehA-like permease
MTGADPVAPAPTDARPNSTLADFPPGYFAFVMATGIVSVAAELRGLHAVAVALLWFNLAAYVVLWTLTLVRFGRHRDRLFGDLTSHQKGAGFLTIVAGTNVLGSQFALIAGAPGVSVALWWLGIVLWGLLLYAFLTAVTFREPKPDLAAGVGGVWLLLVVSTESVAVLGIAVAPHIATHGVLFVSLLAHLIGAMLYVLVIGLIFYRWTFFPMGADQATPPYWINMGALAITTLAGSALILAAPSWDLLAELTPYLKGTTLLFWAFATWWIPLLVVMGFWRHGIRRVSLRYDPQYWAMVFPLGMYSVATAKMIDAVGLPFGTWIAILAFWVALAAWMVTAVAMVLAEGRSRRQA